MLKKLKVFLTFISFIIIIISIYLKFIKQNKIDIPKITLYGKNIITIYQNTNYKEPGYKATESNKNITDKVKIKGKVNTQKLGTYELIYTVKNKKGEIAKAHRFVKVIKEKTEIYKEEYDKIDNKSRGWWSNNKLDGKRPSGGADINELKKYNAFFMGPNEKVLYLTFDEGGLQTYVKEIVDVLNQNNVKATFFLCRKYIEENANLIKEMAEQGHTIANHTSHHLNMPSLATKENFSKYLNEIKEVEKTYYNITGKNMEKVYRDPRGEWSYRDLQIMKDLGYKTYFYSADYLDYKEDVSKEKALNELTKIVHNGAIYLMHPKNKGNYEALDTFIKNMKKQGYKFDLVKNIK